MFSETLEIIHLNPGPPNLANNTRVDPSPRWSAGPDESCWVYAGNSGICCTQMQRFSLDGFLMSIKEKINSRVEEKTYNNFIPNNPFSRKLKKSEHY